MFDLGTDSFVFVDELKTQFPLPKALALDRAGNLYVGCSGQGGLQKFVTADGAEKFTSAWTVQRNKDGYGVLGLAIDWTGNILATVRTKTTREVQRFSAAGTFLTAWGSSGTGPGQFCMANGIALIETAMFTSPKAARGVLAAAIGFRNSPRRGSSCRPGGPKALRMDNSTCRSASPWTVRETCTWPIRTTAAFRNSPRADGSWRSGAVMDTKQDGWIVHRASLSTAPATSTSPIPTTTASRSSLRTANSSPIGADRDQNRANSGCRVPLRWMTRGRYTLRTR